MSDWYETQEAEKQELLSEITKDESLSSAGIAAMQGNVDAQDSEAPQVPEHPQSDGDWITTHPRESLETLPNVEAEPISVKNPEGGSPKPPEGRQPGGPEGGG